MWTLLERHQELRDRLKSNRRFLIARLDQHNRRADSQVEQELAHRQIEIRLAQNGKHLLVVDIQRSLDIVELLFGNICAGN